MPLEPIEEKDLDLENKFVEKGKEEKAAGGSAPEIPAAVEKKPERREGAVEKEAAYAKILSKVKTQAAPAPEAEVKTDAELASMGKGMQARVDNLVNLAMSKGVVHAVKVARHLEDNYILDEFHDKMMADELHDALVQKGLLEDI